MNAEKNYIRFNQEMEIRDAISEVIDLIADLESVELKRDSLEYAMKMLQDQLNNLDNE